MKVAEFPMLGGKACKFGDELRAIIEFLRIVVTFARMGELDNIPRPPLDIVPEVAVLSTTVLLTISSTTSGPKLATKIPPPGPDGANAVSATDAARFPLMVQFITWS